MARNRDPYYLTAKFNGKCGKSGCNQPIAKGERAFYYPASKTILASKCGHAEQAAAEFHNACADEDFYNSQY